MSLFSILILTAGGLLCLYGLWDRWHARELERARLTVRNRPITSLPLRQKPINPDQTDG